MNNDLIVILKAHSIEYKNINGSLFVLDSVFNAIENVLNETFINASTWSKKDLLNWLGY